MMNNNVKSNSITVRRGWGTFTSLALCFALIFLAAPVWSAEDEVVKILAVAAATPDVEVVLHWNEEAAFPTMARLVVRDVFDAEVSSTWIGADEPGFVEASVPDALREIGPRGTHYSVHLEDGAGMVLGASFPYQVTLQCDAPESCQFVLRGGIYAPDAVLLDSALEEALEEATAEGADEMFAAVLANHPELQGEIYTLGWQLAVLEDRFPGAQSCVCRFAAVVENTNSACAEHGAAHSFQLNLTPRTTPGIEGCSEVSRTPGQLLDRYEITGSTTLRVSPLCWNITFSTETEVQILGPVWEGSEELPTAELATCSADCVGGLTYRASYSAEMLVNGDHSGQLATDDVVLEVAGLTQASVFPWEAKTLSSGVVDTESGGTTWSNSAALGAEATVHSVGVVDLSEGTEGFGVVASGYSMEASAQSTCTGPLDAEISASGAAVPQPSTASLVGGHEINILIGRVDG